MLGIVGAMKYEVEVIKEALDGSEAIYLSGSWFYKGTIGDNEVVLTLCGVGKVNAAISTTLLINHFGCDFIINTGVAGGILPLQTKQVILANKIGYHDVDATKFGYDLGQVPGMPKWYYSAPALLVQMKKALQNMNIEYIDGTILSGDLFATDLSKLHLDGISGNIAVEMEGAGVAQTATRFGIPFASIRYISDIIESENQVEDYAKFEEEMSIMSAKICLEILKSEIN